MLLKWLIQFVIGFGVGVYGYLVPSYINLGVFQISMEHDRKKVRNVILLFALIEIPYCLLCMSSMQWLMQQDLIMLIVKWLIVLVLLIISFITWRSAYQKKNQTKVETGSKEPINTKKLIIYAVFNPFQLSAWAIWGAYFIDKTWFDWTFFSILLFSIGASIGVFIILYLYAIIGQKLILFFKEKKYLIDYTVAFIMFILAIFQIIKNIWL